MRKLLAAAPVLLLACSSGDSSNLDASLDSTSPPDSSPAPDSAPPAGDAGLDAAEAAPPPPACDVLLDAAFPDAYYPSVNVSCTTPGDPCALPPNECVFGTYRIHWLKGYCSSSLTCLFTYSREECIGADPVGCDGGACTCGP